MIALCIHFFFFQSIDTNASSQSINMATISEQAEKLLDFSQKLDIPLLDNIVSCMYTSDGQQVWNFYYFKIDTILYSQFINQAISLK